MHVSLCLALCVGGAVGISAAESPSAFAALKTLPPGAAGQLAMIDGHEGNPVPERWHFLIHDPGAENGLREFVVQNQQIVADREVSQFATELTPAEVVGKGALKIDSSAAGKLAQRYAEANEITVASMNFRLKRDELTGRPVWIVPCFDAQDASLATLVVDGGDGRVLGHEGFAVAPPKPAARPPAKAATRLARRGSGNDPSQWDPPPVYEGPREDKRRIEVRRAEPVRRSRPMPPDPVSLIRRLLPF